MATKTNTMKTLVRNSTHIDSKSHDMIIVSMLDEGRQMRKIKMTYEAYNASEGFTVSLFDGDKWNNLFCMIDLGVVPNRSIYVQNNDVRKRRADELINKGIEMCSTILA